MATRPQTIGYAVLDSPIALAAGLLDHNTDSYYKIAGAFVDGKPNGNLTVEHIVDNISVYWLTGTGASGRPELLGGRTGHGRGGRGRPSPARLARRPASPRSPARSSRRREAGRSRPTGSDLSYFNEVDKGGHFAAWEEPELFAG